MNLSKAWAWTVLSSSDPTKFSKTIKGVGTGVITVLAILNLDTSNWSDVFRYTTTFVEALFAVIATWATLTGAIRKVQLTRLGANRVLNERFY